MHIYEKCDICGREIDILDNKQGYNVIIDNINCSIIPYEQEDIYSETWMCCECWNTYIDLLKLKVMWYWLVFLKKIYLILYQPKENLNKVKCPICGEPFIKKHGNQIYCPECKVKHRKEYKRIHSKESYRKKHIYNRKDPICKRCNKPITTEDDIVEFVHGNTKYHRGCFFFHRIEYQDRWALNWFKKNWWILDPRRGIFKYSYYSTNRYYSILNYNNLTHTNADGTRSPYREYRYIMGTLCYNCHEVGAFKTIKTYRKKESDGGMYRIRLKKCSCCGKTHVSKKKVKIYDIDNMTGRKFDRIMHKI